VQLEQLQRLMNKRKKHKGDYKYITSNSILRLVIFFNSIFIICNDYRFSINFIQKNIEKSFQAWKKQKIFFRKIFKNLSAEDQVVHIRKRACAIFSFRRALLSQSSHEIKHSYDDNRSLVLFKHYYNGKILM